MEIYQKAFDIIERYFGTEEEDKDVSEPSPGLVLTNPVSSLQIAPAADSNQFTFGSGGESQQTQQQQGFNF